MSDFRNMIDNQLEMIYAGNPTIVIDGNHDDYAVAFVFGKELLLNYENLGDDVDKYVDAIDELHAELNGKVLFRAQRGSLVESMRTIQGVTTLDELREVILKDNLFCNKDGVLKVTKYGTGKDTRINWDTHLVSWDNVAIGFTNGMLY